ncbi:hypothetical protein SMB554_07730 [Sinorhizobium meliloti]|nr:hypothetical protein SMB554_07730 [Sinorhizobium meliloti]ATB04777.1 hypothetical protein BWO90_22880 [Sinorhizobium meliloti]
MLVTGIQQRRVCGAGAFFQPKDLVWLDSCDKHRNEEIKQAAPGVRISTGLGTLGPIRKFSQAFNGTAVPACAGFPKA